MQDAKAQDQAGNTALITDPTTAPAVIITSPRALVRAIVWAIITVAVWLSAVAAFWLTAFGIINISWAVSWLFAGCALAVAAPRGWS